VIHLIGFDPLLDILVREILPWRPSLRPGEDEDSRVGVLNGRAPPRNVHLVWTKGLAAGEEVFGTVLEIREVGDLLDHPRHADIGQVMGSVASADVAVVPREPALLQRGLFVVRLEVPEGGAEGGAMLIQSQSTMSSDDWDNGVSTHASQFQCWDEYPHPKIGISC
jgi:hypothetical protein